MKKPIIFVIIALAILFTKSTNTVFADDANQLIETIAMNMTIKSIDLPGGNIVLKDVGEEQVQLSVPADVGSLEEFKVGDKVRVDITSTRIDLPSGAFTFKYKLNSLKKAN